MADLQPADFWLKLLNSESVSKKASLDRRSMREDVLWYLGKYLPDIYGGRPGAVFRENTFANFNSCFRNRGVTQDYLVRLKFLIRGLETGKSLLGWEHVTVPSMPIMAPREPARFTPIHFRSLNALNPIQAAFCASLEREHELTSSKYIGKILLSAVMYGGLLDKKWLTPLLRGLPDMVRMHGSLMWLDLRRAYVYPKKEGHPEKIKYIHRRWFPDPLTQALIVMLHESHPEHLEACARLDALFSLKDVIYSLAPDKQACPSITEFYEGATTWLGLRMPSFLVSFATGKTASVSLPPHVWTRLLNDRAIAAPLDGDDEESADPHGTAFAVVTQESKYDLVKQDALRKRLTSLLGDARRSRTTSGPARERVEEFLENNIEEMVPVLQMLCRWAIELLSHLPVVVHGRKSRTALQPSSAVRYLNAVDRGLIACAGDEDISSYDAKELREFYDDVIKLAKSKKHKLSSALQLYLFHHFLMRAYGAPVIDLDGLVGRSGPAELSVEANLIGPRMFRLVLEDLGWGQPVLSKLQSVRCLVAMLGYRCGLRRHEAICIRIGDIFGETYLEVVIRTSGLNRPKTRDSKRRIPVHALLEPDELAALKAWRNNRIAEEGKNCLNAPLFGNPGNPKPYDLNDIFTAIHEAMRRVSGDPSARFHHLRHSFPNRLLIALLSDDLPVPENAPAGIRQFLSNPEDSTRLKKTLFGNMPMGRQFLYGISAMLGHADPSTTLLSYVHLCDWMLGQSLRRPEAQPVLSPDAIMKVTGLKRAMVFRSRADSGNDAWVMGSFSERQARHQRHRFPDPLALSVMTIPDKAPKPDASTRRLSDWHLVAHVLEKHQVKGVPCEQVAEALQLSPVSVANWCATAGAIRTAVTRDGRPRHLTALQLRAERVNGPLTVFPSQLKPLEERKLVDAVFRKVSACDEGKLEEVTEGIRMFIDRYNFTQGFVRFTRIDEARAFRRFLKMIGINDSMISVSMFTKTVPATPAETGHQLLVMKKVGVTPDQRISSGKRHYRGKHECSIAFSITLRKQRGKQPAKKSKDQPEKKRKISEVSQIVYGFRYAIYLLAITLGMTPSVDGS